MMNSRAVIVFQAIRTYQQAVVVVGDPSVLHGYSCLLLDPLFSSPFDTKSKWAPKWAAPEYQGCGYLAPKDILINFLMP